MSVDAIIENKDYYLSKTVKDILMAAALTLITFYDHLI